MRRGFRLSLLVLAIVFGVTVTAQEKPTKEFQDLMKSNRAIAPVDGGVGFGGEGQIGGSLREHLNADDYEAIAKDAATLKANFAKIEAFFTERKLEDAINFSKAGAKAVADIETAAKAKEKEKVGVAKGQVALAAACRGCHLARRVHVVTAVPMQFEIKTK